VQADRLLADDVWVGVLDHSERSGRFHECVTPDADLLLNLAEGGALRRLARLDLAPGELPEPARIAWAWRRATSNSTSPLAVRR
jgi:hypothetical protein